MIKSKKMLNLLLAMAIFSLGFSLNKNISKAAQVEVANPPQGEVLTDLEYKESLKIYEQIKENKDNAKKSDENNKINDPNSEEIKTLNEEYKRLYNNYIWPQKDTYTVFKYCFPPDPATPNINTEYMNKCIAASTLFKWLVAKELTENDKFKNRVNELFNDYQEKLKRYNEISNKRFKLIYGTNVENPIDDSSKVYEEYFQNKRPLLAKLMDYIGFVIPDLVYEGFDEKSRQGFFDYTISESQIFVARDEMPKFVVDAANIVRTKLTNNEIGQKELNEFKDFVIKEMEFFINKPRDLFLDKMKQLSEDQKIQYIKYANSFNKNFKKMLDEIFIKDIYKANLQKQVDRANKRIEAINKFLATAEDRLNKEQKDSQIYKMLEKSIKDGKYSLDGNIKSKNEQEEILKNDTKLNEKFEDNKKKSCLLKNLVVRQNTLNKIAKLENKDTSVDEKNKIKTELLNEFEKKYLAPLEVKNNCESELERYLEVTKQYLDKIKNNQIDFNQIKDFLRNTTIINFELPKIVWPDSHIDFFETVNV